LRNTPTWPEPGARRFKLATFNVHNLGRGDNPDPATYESKLAYLTDVLSRLGADVVVINEVREPDSFSELADRLGAYPFRALSDAPEKYRRIQIGFLSRLPVQQQGQWFEFPAVLPEATEQAATLRFRRPVPWFVVSLPNEETLLCAAVHLKSQRAETDELPEQLSFRQSRVLGRALATTKRTMEAAGLRCLLDDALEAGRADHHVILGDFNDGPESAAVMTLMALDEDEIGTLEFMERRRLFSVTRRLPPDRAFSYVRRGRRQMIDGILVSTRLSLGLVAAGVESQLLEGDVHWQTERVPGYPRSDHAPVWAEFELPARPAG
jgi:endonuclease/exonuclease/phosphatase family metal-dependent hydrolase